MMISNIYQINTDLIYVSYKKNLKSAHVRFHHGTSVRDQEKIYKFVYHKLDYLMQLRSRLQRAIEVYSLHIHLPLKERERRSFEDPIRRLKNELAKFFNLSYGKNKLILAEKYIHVSELFKNKKN